MKKEQYYSNTIRRRNVIKEAIFNFFLGIASGPRLLIEVFIRTSFGERYFKLSTAVILATILFFLPIFFAKTYGSYFSYGYEEESVFKIILRNITWYIYLGVFIHYSLKRKKEIMREPSVFDFGKFSLSSGIINPYFYTLKIGGKKANPRTISTLLEPALFLAIGIILTVLMQKVGILLIVCSICYSFSYYGAYHLGDEFMMDTIDEMIVNQNLVNTIVNDKPIEETQGFQHYGRRPTDPDLRRRVVNQILENDEPIMAK
jgi:hypothetical protein